MKDALEATFANFRFQLTYMCNKSFEWNSLSDAEFMRATYLEVIRIKTEAEGLKEMVEIVKKAVNVEDRPWVKP